MEASHHSREAVQAGEGGVEEEGVPAGETMLAVAGNAVGSELRTERAAVISIEEEARLAGKAEGGCSAGSATVDASLTNPRTEVEPKGAGLTVGC